MADDTLRPDGTRKGSGFFGPLKQKSGKTSTEISIGVEFDGRETQIPTLVPTLTRQEVDHLLSGGSPTPEIVRKATEHARARMREGKSPFAHPDEEGKSMPDKKPTPIEDEFADVVSRLSPKTREMLQTPSPTPTPTPTKTPEPPKNPPRLWFPRYGAKPTPSPTATPDPDYVPANLREADTELKRQGYTKGIREGDKVIDVSGMKRRD